MNKILIKQGKNGAKITEIPYVMLVAMMEISMAWKLNTTKLPVITSGSDHAKNRVSDSKHPKHLAYDLRTRDLSDYEKSGIVRDLKIMLGRDYDVVLESSHIHLEYKYDLE